MGNSSEKTSERLVRECAALFRGWIRQHMPKDTSKRVAAVLGASPKTVDCWMDSENPRLPGVEHLLAAFSRWGPEFAAHVLAPCGDWTRCLAVEARLARIRREIEDLKREMDAIGSPQDVARNIELALTASTAALEKIPSRSKE
jgi:hypothetical protein